MSLTFLGKDTKDDGSPTLYLTEHDTLLIQGWIVTAPGMLGRFDLGHGETLVEVPHKLMSHLPEGEAVPNNVRTVFDTGTTYVFQGVRVTDPAVLSQLDLPDHETVIEVGRPLTSPEAEHDGAEDAGAAATP